MMQVDGINGEMVFPTIGLYVFSVPEPRGGHRVGQRAPALRLRRIGGRDSSLTSAIAPGNVGVVRRFSCCTTPSQDADMRYLLSLPTDDVARRSDHFFVFGKRETVIGATS
jgi:hypothetical protein